MCSSGVKNDDISKDKNAVIFLMTLWQTREAMTTFLWNTVLGQKDYSHSNLYKSTSLSPISFLFTAELRYINKFFWKKFQGAPPKITPHFLDFSKKSATQKTRFFPPDRNFGHRFLKKGSKSSIFGVADLENVFGKLSIKKLRHAKNFDRDPPHPHFRAFFRKNVFQIFLENESDFSLCGQITAEIKETFWKKFFKKRAQNPQD